MTRKRKILSGIAIVMGLYVLAYFVATLPVFDKYRYGRGGSIGSNTKTDLGATFYTIDGLSDVREVVWAQSNKLYLQTDKEVFSYNIQDRSKSLLITDKENFVIGTNQNGELLICSWVGLEVTAPGQTATKITVSNFSTKTEKVLNTEESVYLTSCSENELYAANIPPLEEKLFRIDIASESTVETQPPVDVFSIDQEQVEKIVIQKNAQVFKTVDKMNNIIRVVVSPDESYAALITSSWNVVIARL